MLDSPIHVAPYQHVVAVMSIVLGLSVTQLLKDRRCCSTVVAWHRRKGLGLRYEDSQTLLDFSGYSGALATAVVTIASEAQPPRRFIAGADAIAIAEQKVADLHAQIDAYRDLSSSLAFDRGSAVSAL